MYGGNRIFEFLRCHLPVFLYAVQKVDYTKPSDKVQELKHDEKNIRANETKRGKTYSERMPCQLRSVIANLSASFHITFPFHSILPRCSCSPKCWSTANLCSFVCLCRGRTFNRPRRFGAFLAFLCSCCRI